jgi:hypothetical protein
VGAAGGGGLGAVGGGRMAGRGGAGAWRGFTPWLAISSAKSLRGG